MRPVLVVSVLPSIAAALLAACAGGPSASSSTSAPASPTAAAPLPAAAPATAPRPPRAGYICDRSTRFEVTFEPDAAQVTLLPGGERLVLPQQPSGSGYRYATPRHELRGKGDDATWTVGRSVPEACKATRLAP